MELSLLRENREFRRLWLVGLCFRLATGVRRIAIPWFVLDRTGSPLQLGIALALGSVDALAAPVLGPLVDRLPRRTVVAGGLAGYGLTLLALPGLATVASLPLPVVYVALVALGVAHFAYHNARHAWVPELVADLDAANALIHGTGAALSAVFLLAGGILTTALSALTALGVAGVAALVALLPLVGIDSGASHTPETRDGDGTDGSSLREITQSFLADAREGASYVRGTLAVIVALSVGINLVMPAYGLLFAALGEDVFGIALAYTAMLVAFDLGKLGGNSLVTRLDWSRVIAVRRGVLLSGGTTVALGGVGALAVTRLPTRAALAVVTVAAAVVGLTQPLFNVPSDSIVQALVPDERRGTVVTFTNALYQLPFPLAYLGGGWLAERFSPFAGFAVAGSLLLVLGVGTGSYLTEPSDTGTENTTTASD